MLTLPSSEDVFCFMSRDFWKGIHLRGTNRDFLSGLESKAGTGVLKCAKDWQGIPLRTANTNHQHLTAVTTRYTTRASCTSSTLLPSCRCTKSNPSIVLHYNHCWPDYLKLELLNNFYTTDVMSSFRPSHTAVPYFSPTFLLSYSHKRSNPSIMTNCS